MRVGIAKAARILPQICGSPAPRGQKHVDAMRTFAVGPSSKQAASSSPISHEPRYNVMYFEVIETALARGTAVSTANGL